MTRATVSADGETITVHIPLTFRKRGGRKLVVTPDGASWAPRPRVDNAMVKALARAFWWRKMLDEGVYGTLEDLPRRSGSHRPTSAASCGSRCSRRRSLKRSWTGGSRQSCSWMICWTGFRWRGRGSVALRRLRPIDGTLCLRLRARRRLLFFPDPTRASVLAERACSLPLRFGPAHTGCLRSSSSVDLVRAAPRTSAGDKQPAGHE